MAVNLHAPETLLPIAGVRLASVNAGIRYKNRNDLLLIELEPGSHTAAVFTRNAFCAAPVHVCRSHLQHGNPRYLLINAGNANAGTGEPGMQAARECCEQLAEQGECWAEQVLPFSTGVIGMQLPVDKIVAALPEALAKLDANGWLEASRTIMTTDTVGKAISRQVEIFGETITISGIAKGAGMIHPNMATMLAYVATDALIEKDTLQRVLNAVVEETFNCITVDGDTSTNDSLVLMATGSSGVYVGSTGLAVFQQAVQDVCLYLAQAIVRDGEGATKFISVVVEGAATRAEARAVGNTVALSPLVKTALFASDPNWGRILAAVGRSPVDALDVGLITIWLGDTLLIENGEPAASYREELGAAETRQEEIIIRINLGRGDAAATTWTCDFSYDYVKINAEYRS
ncbi:MAG TPA: bifunctional glutamate N-acetyltransferase/amino-acid acetyltransferase ArgJ [Candidatus Thiothrix moscowensis]|uniref:bifunctional glutamate N-acetyltransferase/amino-acid acetyltransferase ArgJ n=1 Tax=unclassified Thiothrix TaxID=2636184 RepID=UPI0025ED3F15|nr:MULTISPECIES: bifunctional glutamate N-acetyltransferase/amino-acid acetyltransferase ArgJ [unclassified Thiothrix]HRJ51677.1 bifunctional glutamate N-acetyltransferase/amino-acid acetyltransferase ArgJ [Candidatus Thiothrix moscowensis]HRJ91992.1 bifunctional glutamate N-acetyltransferase/amino-acid acetyltransferase ArgJ [Candidatus Thiothrix moscowensis]